MDADKIIKQLAREYPGKNIVKNNEANPSEIVCETKPATAPGEKGVAVAVIDRSKPHYHKTTVETYKVISGILIVYVNGQPHKLETGEKLVVLPGGVHYATGKETWVEVVSEPGWTSTDHFPAE